MTEIRIEKKKTSAWSIIVALLATFLIVALIAESSKALLISPDNQSRQPVDTHLDEFIAFTGDSAFLNENLRPATVYQGLDLLSQAYQEVLEKQDLPSEELQTRLKKLRNHLYDYAGRIENEPEVATPETTPALNEAIQMSGLLMRGIQKQYFPELETIANSVQHAALGVNPDASLDMQQQQVKNFFIKTGEALVVIRENLYENLSHLNQD